jgi:tRNA threonylcarbamoyladenosine biosynthesis protein TsaE
MEQGTAMRPPVSAQDSVSRAIDTPEAMARLGRAIAKALRPGEAICLWGPLGAGKSTLARGLVRALTGPREEVPSPTFTLVQLYHGQRLSIAHFDLYRLATAAEAFELGLDEALEVGAVVVEWPERLQGMLPEHRLDVEISIPETAAGRCVRLSGHGAWAGRDREL